MNDCTLLGHSYTVDSIEFIKGDKIASSRWS